MIDHELCTMHLGSALHCRPNFFYASVLIFFHNVLQCEDELPDVPGPRCAAGRSGCQLCGKLHRGLATRSHSAWLRAV